ncbi:recombinase family protein [Sinanaerobacter chloroacetimidivorans]|uniref:Recombinase family protein n=1 Tax=Sinanaerobacter chloroacetimidivorans TaxID=2818044 RepID=A0A8J7VWQ2_9FIRM|nr:recombinase family protein [Sinanaerobacter chloroacetimidivorans]MBR0596447.1 recombinase family protein [Sinanaerobacter chloroacetimidivorans]
MAKKQVKIITKIEPVSTAKKLEVPQAKRVCAYCRVSTGSTEQNSSFESQVEYYTRLIDNKDGWICVGIYADQARSGTKTSGRDDFKQMLHDCRLGKIDLIITKSVTRFARNTVDSIKAIRKLKSWGVEVYFEKERVSSLSEKSEQLLTILSSIAQGESENISTNSRWANTYRFQNGTFTIGSPAYGYVNNENGELVIQKEEAAIVRRIFDEYLGGKGSYAIAKKLRKEGLPTIRDSKGWQDSVIKGILQNPVYEGDLLYQKTYTTEGVPFIKKHNHGELPQYLITDNHESIISREEAEAVRQLYEYRRKKQCVDDLSVYQSRYAFSSRIVCGECGSTFRRQKIYIGKPYEKIQWCCHQHIEDISKCGQKSIREDIIKQAFVTMWNRLSSNYQEILIPLLTALKAVPDAPEQEREFQELENKIQELKKQSYMLQKVLSDGDIGSAVFIGERNRIDTALDAAYRRLQLLKEQKLYEQEIGQTEYLIAVRKNRPSIIEEFDEECFGMIIDKVVAYPDRRLVFRLKNGLELSECYGKEM